MPISLSLNKLKISLHLVCQTCSCANPFPFCQEHAVVLQRNISQNVLPLFSKWKASFRNRSSEYIKNVTLNLRAAALSSVMRTGYSWGYLGWWRTSAQQSPSGTVRSAEGLIPVKCQVIITLHFVSIWNPISWDCSVSQALKTQLELWQFCNFLKFGDSCSQPCYWADSSQHGALGFDHVKMFHDLY